MEDYYDYNIIEETPLITMDEIRLFMKEHNITDEELEAHIDEVCKNPIFNLEDEG